MNFIGFYKKQNKYQHMDCVQVLVPWYLMAYHAWESCFGS